MIHRLASSRPGRIGRFVGFLAVVVLLAGAALVVWFVVRPGMAPIAGGKPNAPPETLAEIPFTVDLSKFPVAAEKAAPLTREAGGAVELPDGMRVEIPAGALSADATVTLPCPSPGPASPRLSWSCKAFHVHDGKITEVPGQYDAQRRTMVVRTRTFSALFVGLVAIVAAVELIAYQEAYGTLWAEDLGIAEGEAVGPLPVPYDTQGGAGWCWGASAQMLLGAYDRRDVPIWSIAGRLRSPYTLGLSGGELAAGNLDEVFRGLPVDHTSWPYSNAYHLSKKIIERLRMKQPVWLGLPINHAVLAVGFDSAGVFIHDPSGYLVDQVKAPLTEKGRYAAAHVRWPDFIALCSKGSALVGALWVDQEMKTDLPPVGMTLRPDQLQFARSTPKPWDPRDPWDVYFAWDGTADGGFRFCVKCDDPPNARGGHLDPKRQDSPVTPLYAARSDTCLLSVTLANGGREPIQGATVSATLAGKTLGSAAGQELKRFEINKVVQLTEPGVSLKDLLPAPGEYPLKIEARATGDGRPASTIELKIPVGPSRVTNLKLEPRDGDTYLVWEAVELNVRYHVYYVQTALGRGVEMEDTGEKTEGRIDPSLLAAAGPKWLYVVAVHQPTGLSSPPSDFLPLPSPATPVETPPGGDKDKPVVGTDKDKPVAHAGPDLSRTEWFRAPSGDLFAPTEEDFGDLGIVILDGKPGQPVRAACEEDIVLDLEKGEARYRVSLAGTYDGKHLNLKATTDKCRIASLSGDVVENNRGLSMTGTVTWRQDSGPPRTDKFKIVGVQVESEKDDPKPGPK